MANYRPKSLDELNSFYDKSIASQNVIKDNVSAINLSALKEAEATTSAADEFFSQQADFSPEKPCADLSEDINKFIRNFGKPATQDDEPVHRTVSVRPMPSAVKAPVPQQELKPTVPQAPAVQPEPQKAEKAEFVMTPERSELFDEYMRIMSDEDDDNDFSKVRSRRKKGKKKSTDSFTEPEGNDTLSPAQETEPTYEPPVYPEDDEKISSFTDDSEEAEDIIQQDETPSSFPDAEENEVEEYSQPQEKKRNPVLHVAVILALLVTLLSALVATALRVVVKVDSGELFADKYYIYTAEKADTLVGLEKGDLLVAEKTNVSNGDVFAYLNSADNTIGYAVKTFGEGSEITTGDNSDGPVRLRNTDIRGKVTRIYPSIGTFAGFVTDNFIVVIAAHLVLILVLMLILIFGFGKGSSRKAKSDKDNFSFDEDEDFEETLEEHFSLTERK